MHIWITWTTWTIVVAVLWAFGLVVNHWAHAYIENTYNVGFPLTRFFISLVPFALAAVAMSLDTHDRLCDAIISRKQDKWRRENR